MLRQNGGNDTEERLAAWHRGQPAAERLAAHILRFEGFQSIDPSHPLGGPDGLKDVVCKKDGLLWIGAFYFPTSQQTFPAIKRKFTEDLAGVAKNKAKGIAFVTNQRLRVEQRKALEKLATADSAECEILHLETLISLLNDPLGYGVRLEFLQIEMTSTEQVSFFKALQEKQDVQSFEMRQNMAALEQAIRTTKSNHSLSDELEALKKSIDSYHPNDPLTELFAGSSLILGYRKQSPSEQLSNVVGDMSQLSQVLPQLAQQLPQILKTISSLSIDNDPIKRAFRSNVFEKTQAEKFREGVELLERLAKVSKQLRDEGAEGAFAKLAQVLDK